MHILKAFLKLFIHDTVRWLFIRSIQVFWLATHVIDSLAHFNSWPNIHVLVIVIPARVRAQIVSSHILSMLLVMNKRPLAGLIIIVVVLHFILWHLLLVLLVEHKVPSSKPLVPKGLFNPTVEFVD